MNLFKKVILVAIVLLVAIKCSGVAYTAAKRILPQTDTFAIVKSNGYKRIRSLKKKNGEFIGYIYAKENPKYAGDVFTALLVIKVTGLKLDTLYQINLHGDFINSAGKTEDKNTRKDYNGFKLYKEKKNIPDVFSIGDVDNKGRLFSDDNNYLFVWDYGTKKIAYFPAP